MNEDKVIYTGLYLLADMNNKTSIGGVSALIHVPSYNIDIQFFINNSKISTDNKIDGAQSYNFNLSELESIQKAIEKALNDIRKLKSLSRSDLLKDEAYCGQNAAPGEFPEQ